MARIATYACYTKADEIIGKPGKAFASHLLTKGRNKSCLVEYECALLLIMCFITVPSLIKSLLKS